MPKIRIIPDKIFHKLWRMSEKYSKEEYLKQATSSLSNEKIDLLRYEIKEEEVYNVLVSIYEAANITPSDLLKKINMSKAGFSHAFCIPIRTVEDWCCQKNKMPGYMKLAVLNALGCINLGKTIETDISLKYRKCSRPLQSNASKTQSKRSKRQDLKSSQPDMTDGYDIFTEEETYSKILPAKDMPAVLESIKVRELLERTDYISQAAKKHSSK